MQLLSFQVDQDGSCLFHSIRRNINCPKEYTSVHLRRQIIAFICDHSDFYINYQPFIEALRGTYGWNGAAVSLVEYLEMMMVHDSWGDEICLTVISHMWAVGITVMYPSEQYREWRIRHDVPLNEADFTLCYSGQSHYSPIGKYLSLNTMQISH